MPFQSKYKPEYCQLIIDMMSQGSSKTQVAAHLKVDRGIFEDWAAKHPDFKEALALAEQGAEAYYETRLKALADNPDLKSVAPIKALEFLMGCRFRKSYAKTSVQHQEININQITKMSDNDLDAQIQRLLPQYAQPALPSDIDAIDGEIVDDGR